MNMTTQPAERDEREASLNEIESFIRDAVTSNWNSDRLVMEIANNLAAHFHIVRKSDRRSAPQGVEDKNDNRAYSWCHSLERERATGRAQMCLWPTCKCPRVSAPTPPRPYAEVAREFVSDWVSFDQDTATDALAAFLADVAAKAVGERK